MSQNGNRILTAVVETSETRDGDWKRHGQTRYSTTLYFPKADRKLDLSIPEEYKVDEKVHLLVGKRNDGTVPTPETVTVEDIEKISENKDELIELLELNS